MRTRSDHKPLSQPLVWEDVAPRDEKNRFRLYRLCENLETGRAEPELVVTCATPEAVGLAIVTLANEGEWERCPFGLLDTHGTDEEPGTWLVNPWEMTVEWMRARH